ncbi:MAG TPA: cellulase family glycosylhydrolase [Gemmataceae bacterium]|nr:cellulase family glycosylhydrolase [Gemmataceae bacterium]
MPRTVRLLANGDDIKFLQQRLNERPPSALPALPINGIFDAATDARVREYQTDNALFTDGIVGPITWSSLLGHSVVETPGFFTLDRQIHDRLGEKVLLRGINKMSVFDNVDPDGILNFAEIKKTGANTVRIVWAITSNLAPGGPATDPARLDTLISNAKANHLIPMIELHDATGDLARLGELVDYWTRADIVAIVRKHEQYLLLNIGNEVGDDTVTAAEYQDEYQAAISRLRTANIHVPLVLDAPTFGQNLQILNDTAIGLRDGDPQGNLIFSVHLYWSISHVGGADVIKTRLEVAAAINYPLIVGEFSQFGGEAGKASMCSAAGEIDYKAILEVCHSLQLGWYAWEWGPGNDFFDPLCDVMDMTPDRWFAHIKAGWAVEVATSSPFGIKSTSITPASI